MNNTQMRHELTVAAAHRGPKRNNAEAVGEKPFFACPHAEQEQTPCVPAQVLLIVRVSRRVIDRNNSDWRDSGVS